MAKVRIYEIARDLDLESKDVLEKALELGYEVKTASSSVEESDADLIKLAFEEPSAEAETAPDPEPDTADEPDDEAEDEAVAETEPDTEDEPEPEDADDSEEEPAAEPSEIGIATVHEGMTVSEFAEAIGVGAGDIVKALMLRGRPAGVAAQMPSDMFEEIAETFDVIVDVADAPAAEPAGPAVAEMPTFEDDEADLKPRPPVITVMGHVDHGKTSLLDRIRKANVVQGEAGGITQHIGAYQVEVGGNRLTFIDTPGHEAFTTMRARGADVTDIVVLVVAADDGVMPQTIEAISHAKAAGVEMVVAINKIDLPAADPLRVRTELTQHGVIVEELGGDTTSVEVSAETGDGIDNLLEVLDLIAQIQEYKANPKPDATAVVIESQLDPGMGPTATVIVKRGTLKQGDSFVAGPVAGRARALMDHEGNRLKAAGPSSPVLIMGWSDVPTAGDILEVVENDKEARAIAADREQAIKDREQSTISGRERLQGLLEQLRSEDTELRVILKADAHGSLEALKESIAKITREDGRIDVVHGAVGGINENDVTLAEVTGAIIVGFNVRPDPKARRSAEETGIEIRTYGIIYELLDELEAMLVGRLAPDEQEVVLGSAEVRALFKVPRAGTIAGCYVTEGVVQRGARARLLRGGVVVYNGRIDSLRRFKDDVREVASGFECGIGLENYNDVKEGDVIEVYEIREVART
ncbi:MAG: translation initiation factor IF-2 [Acidimicrobiia bacterium]|nr:translation initiation factor IF-2 [Acidimicrobiia bacterium]